MGKELGLIEDSYRDRTYLLRQEIVERYTSGKTYEYYSHGDFSWRADYPPTLVEGSLEFIQCNGNKVTLAPTYGGEFQFEGSPEIAQLCPISSLASSGIESSGSTYTNENARDAVGASLQNTESISFVVNDATNSISAEANFGSTAGTVTEGNDPRLSDARTPTAHTHSASEVSNFAEAVDDRIASLLVPGSNVSFFYNDVSNTLTISATGGEGGTTEPIFGTTEGTSCEGNDPRLSDDRTPTNHAATHKGGGSDPIRLDEFAAPTSALSLNSQKIINLADPTDGQDAVTRTYSDRPLTENPQTGTAYTLQINDTYNKDRKFLTFSNGSDISLTIPSNASAAIPVGSEFLYFQGGAGQVVPSPESGVALLTPEGAAKSRVANSSVGLIKAGANTWRIFGDLTV